jgi:hypothetical protein
MLAFVAGTARFMRSYFVMTHLVTAEWVDKENVAINHDGIPEPFTTPRGELSRRLRHYGVRDELIPLFEDLLDLKHYALVNIIH